MFSKNKSHDGAKKHGARHKHEAEAASADEQDVTAQEPVEEPATEEAAETAPEEPELSAEAVELAALKDRYARLMADFDNYRKRQLREHEEFVKRANEKLLGDMLPVVDNMELAISKAADQEDPFVKGVTMVHAQLIGLLERYAMQPLDAAGEPFDPTYHEALSQMPSATVPANVVIEQFRRGWLLAGRLLRPAQVIVSAGPPDEAQAEGESESVSD